MLLFTLISHDGGIADNKGLEFLVVDCPTEHNILLGRPALFKLQVIPSTCHGILKFSTSDGSKTIVAIKPDNGCDAQRERK